MGGIITNLGARFIVGDPHPSAGPAEFAQAVMLSREVRTALRGSRYRLLHVEPLEVIDDELDRSYCAECEAVFYDYTRNRALRVRGAAGGNGPLRVATSREQPRPSPEEYQEAVALVAQSAAWGPLLQGGTVQAYDPMPPNLEPRGGEEVERTLYVGLYSRPRRFNRIVAVNMVRREVSQSEVTPASSRANGSLCGPEFVFCARPRRGTAGSAKVVWPAPPAETLWSFEVVRPSASSGTNGSGVDLRNIRYRNQKVLRQAHVPVLNVEYQFNLCGPYRDWLYEETCFNAVGTDIQGSRGVRWCTEPPQTIFETDTDGGNFVGVALWEHEDGSLRALSICAAGWYRYATEWRFHPDGRIEPRFRFGATADSCTCNAHNHHAYWRFDWDIFGSKNSVDSLVEGIWTPLTNETMATRTAEQDIRWRVRGKKGDGGYEIITGENDGVGDDFSGADAYLMKKRKLETDDGHSLTSGAQTTIDRFVKGEKLAKADIVTWYVAHFNHTQPEADALDHSHGGEFGPTLQPFDWPAN